MADLLGPHRKKILQAVRRHRGLAPRVFGSVARGEARSDSDVDLLVRFERGADIFDRIRLQIELEDLLGRKVDVVPEGRLKWYVAPQALAEAVAL